MKAMLMVVVVGAAVGWSLSGPRASAVAAPPAPVAAGTDQPVPTVLDRRDSGHFLTIADVNGEPIRFVVDTGADTVALTQDDARRAHVAFDPAQFEVVGRGASGPVTGQRIHLASVTLDGKRAADISGIVLANSDVSLLGQSYLRHLSAVEIAGDRMTLR